LIVIVIEAGVPSESVTVITADFSAAALAGEVPLIYPFEFIV
jgi:hypothetical protein